MGIILVCGNTHLTKFLNQRQDASLSLPPNMLKRALVFIGSDKIIFEKHGNVGSVVCIGPHAISQEKENFLSLSIECTQLNRVANFYLTQLFY